MTGIVSLLVTPTKELNMVAKAFAIYLGGYRRERRVRPEAVKRAEPRRVRHRPK
jgi:hypothetical protein